jgi:hypothetical protein
MTDISRNIFVIGDLIIDHTVFVQELPGPHKQVAGEPLYQVIRRSDAAGGAANTARILSVFNAGKTFLWGVTGESHWGTFRSILERSQSIDGAKHNIEFRGVQDETRARMNTVTRLVQVVDADNGADKLVRKVRFDDYGHVHVSDDKMQTVLHYLKRAHEKFGLDAIVVNDFDMNTLTGELVTQIAHFANSQSPRIPLFIDPKHTWKKYTEIEGTAIFPNLSEWCALVGQNEPNARDVWRNNLDKPEKLVEMAELSFHYLGNFRYHVIKCDRLGAVVLAPHPDEKKKDRYAVYRIPAHKENSETPMQLANGDVLTGIIALEYSDTKRKTKDFINAYLKANAVVAGYRDMPWQRMPSKKDVLPALKKLVTPKLLAEPSKGMLFLPKNPITRLGDFQTEIPGLFSADTIFQNSITELLKSLQEDWKSRLESLILGAPAGSGKSTIMSALKKKLENVDVLDWTDKQDIRWDDPNSFFDEFIKLNPKAGRRLVLIDEALKAPMGKKLSDYGVRFLNSAHTYNFRFLFIDAGFMPEDKLPVNSEFTSRCQSYYLPSLAERPIDIPLIAAGVIFSEGPSSLNVITFEGKFLLALTNTTLSKPNPRVLCQWAKDAYKNAIKDWNEKGPLMLKYSHLPKVVQSSDKSTSVVNKNYEFYRVN